ncbi:MAG: NAD(P)/FAD-dependent oxidoreductase [Thaumarchaeota archaeon]|nr:NAD(P)/FAD-dependent oxidoreductase [Nitrososphaerota archaeon]MBI3023819.1 NAD(P)/FAD-dependent oxidoreductase [Nitrososphaerota archaeon]
MDILVLGCGIGGLVASNVLKERLGDRADVTVVDKMKFFRFPPSYPWVMLGERKPEQVQRKLEVLRKKGIKVLTGEVSAIDLESRSVQVNGSGLSYDYLVIALGAQYAPERIPGLLENSHHIYDLDSALRFWRALKEFDGGTIAVGVSSLPFKCPAAPYEAAFLIDHYFRERGLGDKVRIRFFTPEGLPLPSAGPDIGNSTFEFMKSRGIDAKFKVKLKEVKSDEAVFEDGSTIRFDLLFAVPPHICPEVVQRAGLTDQTGWIPVDPATMRTSYSNVYAVGDITAVPTPSGFVPYLPKAGVFAHRQAEIVANNLAVEIKHRGREKAWDGGGACFLMTGGGQAGFVKGTWFAKPHPDIEFHSPSRIWYMQRVLFEKYWMRHWF